jgi:sterigmatocystin biosynthesis cytochrome P450 monooxygenase
MAAFKLNTIRVADTLKIWLVIGILSTIATVIFSYRLYQARSFMRRLQREGMPMPPHHWLFGHIPVVAKIFRGLPPHAHLLFIADQVRRTCPYLDTAFYLDIWPFGPPSLMVISPELASQFTQDKSLPKYEGVRQFLKPLTGKKDLVTMEGHDWKYWRANFNPGFSANNITNMIPGMVDDVQTYKDIIRKHAVAGDIFPLELPTLAMSMDIIGRVVLDHEFNSQKSYNPLTSALIDQLAWCNAGVHSNPLEYINIARPVVQQYNAWRMNSYVDPLLKRRYETVNQRPKSKYIADLIMSAYVKENSSDGRPTKMDPVFSEFMRAQVKLFLQAGHDTTAASIVYTFYMLQKHPERLCRLREELNTVFGPDITATCDRLKEKPHLLSQCSFLLAVTKETLRLYPPTSTARFGLPGFYLTDSNGKRLPTQNCLVVANHHGIHHNPHFWPRVEEFLPERWLVDENHPLYPVKNGWRPFERGPRNCLGQELAMTEIKLVVAIMVREFKIHDAYAESDLGKGQMKKNLRVNGERAYQIIRGGGHPSENFPCRVSLVAVKEET